MALTVGIAKQLAPGTPTRRYLVPIVLDGTNTSITGLAHGIVGAPGAPDRLAPALGGTTATGINVTRAIPNASNPATQVDVVVSAAGVNTQTVLLELEWLSAF